MSLRHIVLASLLSAAVAFPMTTLAAEPQLAEPVVQLMPHVKKLRDSLDLNAEQDKVLDNWMAEAPLKRKAMEAEARQLRQQMREAILNNESRLVREEIKAQIAEKELRLIEMRALCTRMLRNTLNEEQFAKVLASYRAQVNG